MATYDLTTNLVTLTNLAYSNNISTKNTNWVSEFNTTITYVGETLVMTPADSSLLEGYIRGTNQISYTQGHKYYCSVKMKGTINQKTGQIFFPYLDPYPHSKAFIGLDWTLNSFISANTTIASGNYYLRLDNDNNTTSNIMTVKELLVIDLTTAFGSGNEPSKEWCDNNIPFFEGNMAISKNIPILWAGDILNCPYSGASITLSLPPGVYKLECWGAAGGTGTNYSNTGASYIGGNGGYSSGELCLSENKNVYLYAGGVGTTTTSTSGGFNGGGGAGNTSYQAGSGGGASDIRIDATTLYARAIVAGGGGGGGNCSLGGYGGGLNGCQTPTTNQFSSRIGGIGGSQTSGYSFGQGQGGNGQNLAGGGGGGWYGGGQGDNSTSGGGGSGYVYTASTATSYPSGCLLNSNYYLANATTIAGDTSFLSPTGTSELGHTGDGYIRITKLSTKAAIPTASIISYVYTGSTITLNAVYDTNKCTVTNISATNVGTYTATFVLNNGEVWEDDSTTDKTITWNITKKIMPIPYCSAPYFIYNGSQKTPVISNYSSTIFIHFNGTSSATNIGSYIITYYLSDINNIEWSDGTTSNKAITWKILPASLPIPEQDMTVPLIEDGNLNTPIWTNYNPSLMSISGTTSSVAGGTFSAIFTLTNSNYIWEDNTSIPIAITWRVTPNLNRIIPYIYKNGAWTRQKLNIGINFDQKTKTFIWSNGQWVHKIES